MSISELIKQRYKKEIHKIKTPAEAANLMVKDMRDFDVNNPDYVEGTVDQQNKAN